MGRGAAAEKRKLRVPKEASRHTLQGLDYLSNGARGLQQYCIQVYVHLNLSMVLSVSGGCCWGAAFKLIADKTA